MCGEMVWINSNQKTFRQPLSFKTIVATPPPPQQNDFQVFLQTDIAVRTALSLITAQTAFDVLFWLCTINLKWILTDVICTTQTVNIKTYCFPETRFVWSSCSYIFKDSHKQCWGSNWKKYSISIGWWVGWSPFQLTLGKRQGHTISSPLSFGDLAHTLAFSLN